MKRKYAVEDLDNYINEWAVTRPQDNWITFSEAEDALMKIIELAELPQDAARELRLFFDENPYMHGELGEVEGHNYYEDALNRFIEAFKEKFGEDALDKIGM
ncbi:MAG TPA: hypothetical protein PK122_00230 [Candidatus Paceibacterota bacterium]|nr:hypothetical protein [Candidatus Paceibacterota bacterium]